MSRRLTVALAITTIATTIAIACTNPERVTTPQEPPVTRIAFTITPSDMMGLAVGDTGWTGVQAYSDQGPVYYQPISITMTDPSVLDILTWRPDCGNVNEKCGWTLTLQGRKVGSTVLTASSGEVSASMNVIVWGPRSDYEMIDLGTLGGDLAYPVALNDSGHVVGYSTTAGGEQHAFLWSNGVMRDLGASIPGMSSANTVTNSDRVGITNIPGGPNSHVFVWQNGLLSDLGQVRGDAYSSGIIGMTGSEVVAWATGQEHYFSSIWRGSNKQDLGGLYPPLPSSVAYAMNARGQVVGGSLVSGYVGNDINHPFVWESGVIRELAVLGPDPCPDEPQRDCSAGEAVDINSSGTVVGWSGGVGLMPRAVLWRDGNAPIELGFRRAVAINDSGDVAGNGELSGLYWQDGGKGYFWHQGTVTNLGSLGRGGTNVADINDQGIVVGSSIGVDKRLHAFAWKHGQAGLIDLGTKLSGAAAVALNTRGDVIGWTADCINMAADGTCQAYDQRHARAVLWRAKNP